MGVTALKRLDQSHAELKSMHTRETEKGPRGGEVEHLLTFARREGYRRVSLETGSTDEFVAARALYAKAGFGTWNFRGLPAEPLQHLHVAS